MWCDRQSAGLLAEVCASLFHRYSELLIVAEFNVCLEPWITSRQQCGAERCPHNKVGPTTVGHMNCDCLWFSLAWSLRTQPWSSENPEICSNYLIQLSYPRPHLFHRLPFYNTRQNGWHPAVVLWIVWIRIHICELIIYRTVYWKSKWKSMIDSSSNLSTSITNKWIKQEDFFSAWSNSFI